VELIMADRKQRLTSLALTLALVGLNLIALNVLLSGWSSARLDLTEEGLYSISPSTRRILDGLDEEVTIYGYFSKRTHEKLAPLVPEITDLLDEYRAVSRGKVHVEIFDPSEDDDVAQEAADRYGIQSTPFRLASKYETGIVNAYFALVIKYGDQYERYGFQDLIKVEPMPDGDFEVKLRNLEYDLTRAIKKVVYGFRSTTELFDRIDEPVRMTAIVSQGTLPEIFAEVPDAIRKAADELTEAGGGKFTYEELDPTTDEAARRRVETEWGVAPMSLGLFGDSSFYLYGLLQIGDRVEQLTLTDQEITSASIREAVENSLRRNTPGFLPTIGVFASEPPQIPPQLRMQMNLPPQPPPEFEELKRFLGDDYNVANVTLDAKGGVPSNVDVLVVLKPTDLSDVEVYALDQYLMRGGRVIVCSGKYEAQFSRSGLSVTPHKSGLDDWLAHYGVVIEDTLVLDDRNQALPIPEMRSTPLGNLQTWTMAPYPYLVQVRDEGFADPDITSTLDSVGVYWSSPLTVDTEKTGDLEVLPILRSSDRSWTDSNTAQAAYVDYTVPDEGTEPRLLAVALSGKFESYFANREVPVPEPPESDEENGEETALPEPTTVALKESPETRLIVVGDSAFLSDFVARTIGQVDGSFFVENLRFVENVIDWANLDSDMMAIRARGLVSRRLDRTTRSTEIAIEALSYVVTLLLLGALAMNVRWRRKNAAPEYGPAASVAVQSSAGAGGSSR
jgi:ABC-2 type transport system permease protein